jgi:hypothetical protein
MHLIAVLSRKARQGWGTQFCAALTWIVQEHDVLVVPATGLIPLAIGIGFFVDYQMQKGELEKFGLDVDRGDLERRG